MIRNMKIEVIPAGTYVVAVSGGVDSMVLLDLLRRRDDLQLIVAHVNHGIRETAKRDAELVKQTAAEYGLQFELYEVDLGLETSEEVARQVRYKFLRSICKKYDANLITAHHQDDLIETIIINLLRGTSWRGLCSLRSSVKIRRPLLEISKAEIINYAQDHQLKWFEDETNQDQRYLRNYIRHNLLPQMRSADQLTDQKLLKLYEKQLTLRTEIEAQVNSLTTEVSLSRYLLIMWPEAVALECVQSLIAGHHGRRLLTDQAKRALLFAKTGRQGAIMQPAGWCKLRLTRDELIVEPLTPMLS